MDLAVTIVMMIPVILAVALIINVVRKNILERQAGDPVDISGAIPAVIVLMVAVLIIGAMAYSATDVEDYDEATNTLTIKASIQDSGEYPWDSYGSSVKGLVLNSDVESVPDGAFSSLTGLEYVSIPESVESITPAAFGVSLEDYMGQELDGVPAGEYAGIGDGTVYLCDESLFTYSTAGTSITGLTDAGSKHLVFPAKHNGVTITNLGYQAIASKTALETAVFLPESGVTAFNNGAFKGCSALTHAILPESIQTFGVDAFQNCSSLVSIDLPEGMTTMGASCFLGCTSLESITLPGSMTDMGNYAFNGCSALEAITFPARVSAIGVNSFTNCSSLTTVVIPSTITEVKADAFRGCTGVTSVAFGEGFNATLGSNCFLSWTFYESDGTTTIDKTAASNLAGFTFQGTASALVKLVNGAKSLTPEQTLKVAKLTEAAAKELKLAETEISSVEEKELASA